MYEKRHWKGIVPNRFAMIARPNFAQKVLKSNVIGTCNAYRRNSPSEVRMGTVLIRLQPLELFDHFVGARKNCRWDRER
jgi:hypothetical protein